MALFLGFLPDPRLARRGKKGRFRRVADDAVRPVLPAVKLGAVAQDAAAQGPEETRIFLETDLVVPGGEVALGFVADPRDFEQPAVGVDGPNRHFVPGQRPGLVGTDDRGAAKGLDGRQFPDQGVPFDHPLDAERQGDGHDRGQAFRDRRHCQADGRHEDVENAPAADPFQEEDEADEDETEIDDPFAELFELLLERRRLVGDVLDHLGDLAQFGVHPRPGDDGPGFPRCRRRPHVEHVGPFGQRNVPLLQGRGGLEDRRGLAGQARFLDAEVRRVPDDPAVGRNVVPGLEFDQVSGNEVVRGNDAIISVPDDLGIRGGHPFQGRQRFFGPVFLDESQDRVEDDDGDDRQGVDPFAEEARHESRPDQDPDHEILELVEELADGGALFLFLEPIRAETLEPFGGFRAAEAGGQARSQAAFDLLDVALPVALVGGLFLVHRASFRRRSVFRAPGGPLFETLPVARFRDYIIPGPPWEEFGTDRLRRHPVRREAGANGEKFFRRA